MNVGVPQRTTDRVSNEIGMTFDISCSNDQKQGSSGGIQSGHTIKSCDFFLNPMQQILILSHPILLLFTFI